MKFEVRGAVFYVTSQFEKLDWVELDNNYFRSEVSLGATSTQKG